MNTVAETIFRLRNVSGPDHRGWHTALCPFHNDLHRPNLRFNTNGFCCMACGETGGLKKPGAKLGIQQVEPRRSQERITATYDYRDKESRLLFQVVRYEPKSFKQRRSDGNSSWIWDLKGVRRVPYRLTELLTAPLDQWVFVVEGEKAADELIQRGQIATCSPMEAGKWREEYARWMLREILEDHEYSEE